MMWAFAGGVSPKVTLSNANISETNPGVASVSYTVNTDGTVDEYTYVGGAQQINAATDWIIPNGAASSLYEVRMTQNSGDTLTSGTLNTWLALSTDRSWSYSLTSGTLTGNFTIEIRYNGGSVIDSATVVLTATAV